MNIIDSLREAGIKQLPQSVLEDKTLQKVYACILETEGAEIPEIDWPEAEQLAAAGLITLSGARGRWKRAEPITVNPTIYCQCAVPDYVNRKGKPALCLECTGLPPSGKEITSQVIGEVGDTKKLAAFAQIVAIHFASDPSRASVVVSWLDNDRYYMSVVRYHGKFGADKEVVVKSINVDFDSCFQNLVKEWRQHVGE